MPARVSRRLVIDASVARAAGGEEATFPTSKHCRDFLKAILTICHRMVMTPEIQDEWRTHQSRFTSTWRRSMESRKKVVRVPTSAHDQLYGKIRRVVMRDQDYETMQKDFCLIDAALETDRIVISLDEVARWLFATTSQSVGELASVMWINPDKMVEQSITWLEHGAKSGRVHRLGWHRGRG